MENRDALVEMKVWLDSEPAEFVEFVGRLLSSLPDGENGVFEPLLPDGMGWKEMTLIANLLDSIENGKDVQVALRYLFGI
ncbi:MAG: hypothetical protein GX918_10590 [Clostridiales bacterium]|nr:hypothetical protein [Clostridiales bacterium]